MKKETKEYLGGFVNGALSSTEVVFLIIILLNMINYYYPPFGTWLLEKAYKAENSRHSSRSSTQIDSSLRSRALVVASIKQGGVELLNPGVAFSAIKEPGLLVVYGDKLKLKSLRGEQIPKKNEDQFYVIVQLGGEETPKEFFFDNIRFDPVYTDDNWSTAKTFIFIIGPKDIPSSFEHDIIMRPGSPPGFSFIRALSSFFLFQNKENCR